MAARAFRATNPSIPAYDVDIDSSFAQVTINLYYVAGVLLALALVYAIKLFIWPSVLRSLRRQLLLPPIEDTKGNGTIKKALVRVREQIAKEEQRAA